MQVLRLDLALRGRLAQDDRLGNPPFELGWIVKRAAFCIAFAIYLFAAPTCARAQGNMTIEYKVRDARELAGLVIDSRGAAVPGALVADCDPKYRHVLASTKTDRKGRFTFPQAEPGSKHYLKVDSPGFDEVHAPVRIWPSAKSEISVTLHVGT